MQKQCPRCGATYGNDFEFCAQDGTQLRPLAETVPFQPQPAQPPPSGGNAVNIALVAIVVLLLMIAGLLAALLFINRGDSGEGDRAGNKIAANTATPAPSSTPPPTPTPTPAPTPDKAQMQKLINDKIASILTPEDLTEEDKSARKIAYGDLDGDGDEDVVVHYPWVPTGGNAWGISLMALTYDNGQYRFAADEVVGGKTWRSTKVQSIKNGRINLSVEEYDEEDAACCPSIKGSTSYTLRGGKLVEAKK